MTNGTFVHRPVMVDEIVEVFATVPAGVVLDATLGGGGHTEALLDSRADLPVLGIDRDPAALAAATARLERFGDRFRAVHARFDDLHDLMAATTGEIPRPSSGALFDLGVSSPQLDQRRARLLVPPGRPARHADGHRPRRGRRPTSSTATTSTSWPASSAATATSASPAASPGRSSPPARSRRPPSWRRSSPAPSRPPPAAPAATRRSARSRPSASRSTPSSTPCRPPSTPRSRRRDPGGRIAVLSYHSGEDRIVKDRFRRATGACDCPPDLPCVCGAVQTVRLVRGVPRRPSAAETRGQPAGRVGAAAGRRADRADRPAPSENGR